MTGQLRYVSFSALGALLLFALFALHGATPRAHAVFNDSDGDGVIDLAETISGSDPNSAASTPEDSGSDTIIGSALCHDGIDNDGDGAVDGADSGCQDSDNDIVSNAMETLLGSNPNDSASFPEDARFDAVLDWIGFGSIVTCADFTDNDRDGTVDDADSGCTPIRGDSDAFDDRVEKLFGSDPGNSNSVPEHELANPGSCTDGIDNDLDGLTDAADPSCRPVANDHLSQPTSISTLPFEDDAKISSAGIDSGEPSPNCFFDVPSATVWYSYTASSDGAVVADTTGSNFGNLVAVWTRSGRQFSQVACATGFPAGPGGGAGARSAFQVERGTTYLIQVAGFTSPAAPSNLRFRLLAGNPPANDNFASPHVISSLPFNDTVNTLDATTEFGEPAPPCTYSVANSSVWYRYAASSDGVLLLDATTSTYGAAIDVWTDSPFGLTSVGCANSPPRLAVKLAAGRTYYVQVAGYYGVAAGTLHLSAESAVAPPNDDFANAMNVSSLPFEQTVDTFTATAEFGEPTSSCTYGPTIQTVWYKITPSQSGFIKGTVDNPAMPGASVIAVYQGTSFDALTEVGCSSLYTPLSETAFQATAGQTYYVQVGMPLYRGGKVPTASGGVGPPAAPPAVGVITVHFEAFTVPPCAAPSFTVDDPVGDAIGVFGPPPPPGAVGAPVDVTSVGGGSDGENFCLRVQFTGPIPTPQPGERGPDVRVEFDTDSNPSTGYGGTMEYRCPGGPELGVEVAANVQLPSQVIVPLDTFIIGPPPLPGGPVEQPHGYATLSGNSLQVVIPLSVLGGDDDMHFGLVAESSGGTDCVPNGGGIVSPTPAPMGDVNCDGVANSIDVSLILQSFAGLLTRGMPCQYAGDVNNNGSVGPVDATLILQYTSGMLPAFPPPPPAVP